MIRRSTASILKINDHETVSMRSMIPSHEVRTVELTYQEEEAAESQWVHRAHARLAYSSYRYESEKQIKANVWMQGICSSHKRLEGQEDGEATNYSYQESWSR